MIRFLLRTSTWKSAAFKKTAADYGLRLPQRSIDLLDGDLNLITTSSMFLSSKSLPSHYQIVGPIFAKLDLAMPKNVTAFIKEQKQAGKKIMYLAMGSSGHPTLLKKILHYFSNKQDIAIIAPIKKLLGNEPVQYPHLMICDYLPTSHLKDLIDFLSFTAERGLFKQHVLQVSHLLRSVCIMNKPVILLLVSNMETPST